MSKNNLKMKKYLLLSTPKLLSIKKYFVILFIFVNFIGYTQTITPTKTVTVNPNSCSIIDVELMIQGANPINRPLEVMLVIDVSGSMGYNIQGDTNTPIDYAKDAATDFINNIFLTANNPTGLNKVGIVSFSTTATLRQGLTLASGKNGLLSIINGLSANGTTNNQDGIVKADAELTANGTFNCVTARSIVLLTDGVTNRTGSQMVLHVLLELEGLVFKVQLLLQIMQKQLLYLVLYITIKYSQLGYLVQFRVQIKPLQNIL